MAHDNFLSISPVLDSKILSIDMARPFSRDTVVYHIDSGHVVFIKQSGAVFWVSNFTRDSTRIFSKLGQCNSAKKLSFRIGGGNSGLSF